MAPFVREQLLALRRGLAAALALAIVFAVLSLGARHAGGPGPSAYARLEAAGERGR